MLFLLLVLAFAISTRAAALPAWPSLAEQLRADAVIPHSALEALIAAHQDFSLLRPEEAHDKIPVPPWLRVIWRQAHPELTYSGADPTGGYPLVLKEVHEWMVSHQSLVPGPPDKEATPEEDDAVAAPVKTAIVAGEQRISGTQTSSRSESDIRVNYWDPLKIISASNNISGSGSQAQFYSTDGGATWGQAGLPRQTGDAFHSDPTVEWTSDGTAWSTTIGINSGGSVLHMRSYKSVDKEEIWTAKLTDAPCTPPGAPAIGTATASAPNQIQVTWGNGAPPATSFNVYRAPGTCAAPGAFAKIAPAVAASPYTDGSVAGTLTYAYQVTGLDAGGGCESAPSGCVQATATGTCGLPPNFGGVTSVLNPATATCGLDLSWTAGTVVCTGPLTYNVYRSTTTGFTPNAANRVATGLTGSSYSDISMTLASGTPYFYVVRAVDVANGAEEANTVQRNATPTGPGGSACTPRNVLFSDGFEGGLLPGPWSSVIP